MVAEFKEFLWDVAEERTALWSHCQRLFVRDSLPALQVMLYPDAEMHIDKPVSVGGIFRFYVLMIFSSVFNSGGEVFPQACRNYGESDSG